MALADNNKFNNRQWRWRTTTSSTTEYNPDDELDIETVEDHGTSHLPYVPEADDCEKYAEELRAAPARTQQLQQVPRDGEVDDWEAKVPRVGWTSEHLRLYTTVVKALHGLQLARLALIGRSDESLKRRLAVDKCARRLRRAMASVTWDLRLTHWLHATLQEHMPTPLLAIYLEVLQTLRVKVPSLVDQMLTLSTYNRLGVPVSEELVAPVSTLPANLTGQSTVENMLDQLLTLTRAKIEELKTSAPNRPIILIGWHVGAAIACQAALMETVAAVVCMGFPISTLAGRRGQADDALLDVQCPIYFVIGQNAPTSRQADMEELRERLRVQTGLLVVGSADERLRVSDSKKHSEGLTQAMVDRCILPPPTLPTVAPVSPSVKSVGQTNSTDHSRRQSNESATLDGEPEAKRSRSSTPLPVPTVSTTPSKMVYSTAKQELHLNTNRPATKRTYEASLPQRVMLGSTSSSSSSSADKRGALGSRQGQVCVSGITVNIGSLASLAPIGPIRMGVSDIENTLKVTQSPVRPRVPSVPTTHATITSLSSLLTSNIAKNNSVLLSSNKVLGGDEAATLSTSRSRTLDLSRVTLLTCGSTSKSATMTVSPKTAMKQLPKGTSVAKVVKPQAGSSAATLLSSTSSSSTARPLSPSTILELPVIFAKDGDRDQFAALTAPLPVTLPDEMTSSLDNKQQPN
ncbi:hypothetical protein B566_EDAN010856 [Ephemera danica]|nr:hypothetical protein B566_EDAN010856 [Ephemera danica]